MHWTFIIRSMHFYTPSPVLWFDSSEIGPLRCASSRCCLWGVETRDSTVLEGCKGQKVYKTSRPSMELSPRCSCLHEAHPIHRMELHFIWMSCCTRSCFNGAAWDVFHFRFTSTDWRRATLVVFSELISIICDPHHFLKKHLGRRLSV